MSYLSSFIHVAEAHDLLVVNLAHMLPQVVLELLE